MNPFFLFVVAILTPVLLSAVLFIPLYAGIYSAAYIIYDTGAATHPLADKWLDVFYIIDVYSKLLSYWQAHRDTVDFVKYTLPLLGLPAFGGVLALWLAAKISRGLRNLFYLSSSH